MRTIFYTHTHTEYFPNDRTRPTLLCIIPLVYTVYSGIWHRPCDDGNLVYTCGRLSAEYNNNNNQIGLFVDDVNPMSDTQQKRRFRIRKKYLPTCVVFFMPLSYSRRGVRFSGCQNTQTINEHTAAATHARQSKKKKYDTYR